GEDRAYLDFVLGLKQYFAGELFAKLHHQYETGASEAGVATTAGAHIEPLPSYPLFQWLERNTQKMMWRRLEAMIQPHSAELEARLDRAPAEPLGSLELDPHLPLPDYYTQTEFHIQPGGVWSSAANAFVYE